MIPSTHFIFFAHIENTQAQAEFLLHSLLQAESGFGLHITSDKSESMRFNENGAFTLVDISKLVHIPR